MPILTLHTASRFASQGTQFASPIGIALDWSRGYPDRSRNLIVRHRTAVAEPFQSH
jgi:hypothetical protein